MWYTFNYTMIQFKGKPAITTIVLHNTAVSRAAQPIQRDAVNTHHKGKWNFPSELSGSFIGYNFFCEPTGKRTQERFVGEETIAQIGNNCDSPLRCGMISYCMAGYFAVEKPTQMQVDDFVAFIREVQSIYPNVVLKQHKDVAASRTCAELSDAEIQQWIKPVTTETKDQKIARLEGEVSKLKAQIESLIQMVTTLIKKITK